MKCPKCGWNTSRVINTTKYEDKKTRRRVCMACGERYTTKEIFIDQEKEEEISKESYNNGLKDAWELLKKIVDLPSALEGMRKLIDPGCLGTTASTLLNECLSRDPKEIKEKWDAWKAEQTVKAGDVLTNGDSVGIVIENDGTDCFVLWKHLTTPCRYSTRAISEMLKEGEIVKTDKNVADELQGLWEKAEVDHV